MKKPHALVLFGDGINCERETALALQHSGAKTTILHINDLLKMPQKLREYDLMAIPGGFSFGDELGSGKLLALKIKHGLMDEFREFVEQKKPIIGICNGFQVLVKLGLLTSGIAEKPITLTHNTSGSFINKWVNLEINPDSKCKWLSKNYDSDISLPIRHGEGRLSSNYDFSDDILNELSKKGNVVLRYKEDINGSIGNIAGICSDDGLIFGLMPHPEAAYFKITNTNSVSTNNSLDQGIGAIFFQGIIQYISEGQHV